MINRSENRIRSAIAASHRVAAIVVLAIASSIALYAMIALAVAVGAKPQRDINQLRAALYLVALILAIGSIAVRRILLGADRLDSMVRRQGAVSLASHFLKVTLISAAMGEAVALIGLTVSIVSGEAADFFRLGAVGLAMALISYPRRSAWEQAIEQLAATYDLINEEKSE
jgi:F0F1-type ATP synthase membrane subunit c/vacuolar-type H+-ATPase subunit K